MQVDFNRILNNSATLLGITFVALVLGFDLLYNGAVPPDLKTRASVFVSTAFAAVYFFFLSSIVSFLAVTFMPVRHERRPPPRILFRIAALLCSGCFLAGLLGIFLALMALLGFSVVIAP